MTEQLNTDWPVLRAYQGRHLARIAMPLGGIGTGTVSLGGRGDLRDFEAMNRPAKGFLPDVAFMAIRAQVAGAAPITKLLEGPLDVPLDSANGFRGRWYGMPRFRDASFHAAYPLAQVVLRDRTFPLDVRLEAFNPLIPADADSSGLPLALLRVAVRNRGAAPASVAACLNLSNFVGFDGGACSGNTNATRQGTGLDGVLMSSDGVPPDSPTWGSMAIAALPTGDQATSARTRWQRFRLPFESLVEMWHDLHSDGELVEPPVGTAPAEQPVASIALSGSVAPGAEHTYSFLLCWHFPNRGGWGPTPVRGGQAAIDGSAPGDPALTNYYATVDADAWALAQRIAPQLAELERRTVAFTSAVCDSDLPLEVREAALFNLPALRSQTTFRIADGRLFGWEGCNDDAGCCPGSCTHVWNYEQATAFLFGELAAGMRRTELLDATDDEGRMSFRILLPVERAHDFGTAAADGQMGCLMKLYRDWQLSGDDQLLTELWPAARRALEFAWIEGGWDADRDGVMEGVQHNTTDLEYYGPNPLMAGWYLGALHAAALMAEHLGDDAFATTCRELARRGAAWVDENLFNGEFFIQQVIPPRQGASPAPGLTAHLMVGEDLRSPPQQAGPGCVTDQLVGQFAAHVCGLGHLLDRDHIQTTLRSIYRYNFTARDSLYDHQNPIRAFTVHDERTLLYGSYPHGEMPERPCFRFTENWTGVEYAAAVLMMQEGLTHEGLEVFGAVRERFDGARRSPFDEPECGHHYARAMASWAGILALTGFHYSAVSSRLTFAAATRPVRWFWSTGYGWGTVRQTPHAQTIDVDLQVIEGKLSLSELVLTGAGELSLPERQQLGAGQHARLEVQHAKH